MRRVIIRAVAALAGGMLLVGTAWAQPKAAGSGQVVKIAFLDPLSGPFAAVGQNQLKHFHQELLSKELETKLLNQH